MSEINCSLRRYFCECYTLVHHPWCVFKQLEPGEEDENCIVSNIFVTALKIRRNRKAKV